MWRSCRPRARSAGRRHRRSSMRVASSAPWLSPPTVCWSTLATRSGGKAPARFDLRQRTLLTARPADNLTAPPRQAGLAIVGWDDTYQPTLNGNALQLQQYECSRSLALHPDTRRFVLGTDWSLWAYDATGRHSGAAGPGVVWAVNITAMAAWWWPPTATAPSAGTGWRTAWSCWPSCRTSTARLGRLDAGGLLQGNARGPWRPAVAQQSRLGCGRGDSRLGHSESQPTHGAAADDPGDGSGACARARRRGRRP